MNKPTYTIEMACQSVAEALLHSRDQSPTTIRCAINDDLDAAGKSGYSIGATTFYDQPRAINRVKEIICDLARKECIHD
jgi:hypothetical protein